MRYKHFDNAGVDASVLAIGTWATGDFGYGDVNEKDSIEAFHAMFDNGVNLIDTAPVYGAGHSEEVVGRALKGLDRSKILLSSKCDVGTTTAKFKRTGQGGRDASYANILYECEQSLRRLDTDYIDFYFIHWPDPDTPFEETMAALNKLKEEGKIRYIGVSNYTQDMILESEKYGKIDVIQPPYSMVNRKDEELMKWCVGRGISTFTWGSLGSGILTGTIREIPEFHKGDPRNGFYPFYKEPSFSKVMKVLDVMDEISAETGKSLPQITLNWSTQKDYVSTALCGVRNVKEALDDCETFNWELTADQIAAIDKAIAENIDFDTPIPVK